MPLLTNKMMQFFSLYLKSNIHVSICLIFYSLTISLKNDLHLKSSYIFLMFLFVFGAYNFIKFNENRFTIVKMLPTKKLFFFLLSQFYFFFNKPFLFFWNSRTNNILVFKFYYNTLFRSSFWKIFLEKKYHI